jgi:hypothetical protein
MPHESTSLGQAALEWARAGFAVFPCRPRGKEPLTRQGFLDATANEVEVYQRWRRYPDANIGLPTGGANGIMVVDIDGAEGELLWGKLTARFGEPTTTSQVKTDKGRHLYFALPEDCGKVKSSANGGLDIRGDGGYVIASPSVHPNGGRYEHDFESPEEFAPSPQWLLDFARNREAVLKALEGPTTAEGAQECNGKRATGEGCPTLARPAEMGKPKRRSFGTRHPWPSPERNWREAASIRAGRNPRRQSRRLVESRLRAT